MSNAIKELVELRRSERIKTYLTLLETIERDGYTKHHSIRVAKLSGMIAEELGFPEDQIRIIIRAAIFHDIGKLAIRREILFKKEMLTPDEFEEIKRHPEIGANILRNQFDMKMEAEIVLQHHELLDGSGYPKGLRGREIFFHSRILTVSDVFDAMRADRPYRTGLKTTEALNFLTRNALKKFDLAPVLALHQLYFDGKIEPIYDEEPNQPVDDNLILREIISY